jgi:hypothetical protein
VQRSRVLNSLHWYCTVAGIGRTSGGSGATRGWSCGLGVDPRGLDPYAQSGGRYRATQQTFPAFRYAERTD